MTRSDLDALRRYRAWQTPSKSVTDLDSAVQMLNDTGFLLPWRRRGIDLPTWRDAYPYPVEREPGPIWRWKEVVPQQRKGFYGKVLRRGPCVVSLECLPCFYALAQRAGEREEYLYSYQMGRLSSVAKQVMDSLIAHWPLSTYELRDRLLLKTREGHATLNRALDELQATMFACMVMASDEEDREYTYYWAPVDEAFPCSVRQAQDISSVDAARALVSRYVKTMVFSPRSYPVWLLGLSERTYDKALLLARDGGHLVIEESLDGLPGPWLITTSLK